MGLGKRLLLFAGAGLLLGFLAQSSAYADSYTVTINTSSLVGSASGPFELGAALGDASMAGDGNNTVTLTNFAFGGGSPGAVDMANSTGGTSASGNLISGITLTDTDPSGLNFLLASFTPGNTLSFTFSMTTNHDGSINPGTGLPGDQLTFDIFDNTLLPLATTDPVFGEDSFLVATICTPGSMFNGQTCPTDGLLVDTYGIPGAAATTVVSSTATPEPGTLLLLFAGILGLGILGFRARKVSLAPDPTPVA